MSAPPVLVVGDLVTDVVVRPAGPPAPGSDCPARITTTGGGAAANTAAWLAREGVRVTLVARVGDDASGRERVAELTAAGVRCAVAVDPSAPTGTIVVLLDGSTGADGHASGERSMYPDRGANDRLSPADVRAALADVDGDAAHLHLSGYVLLGVGSREAGGTALREARARGWTTSVDVASAAPLAAAGRSVLRATAGVDLLLANADEAAVLSGCADPRDAARALAAGVGAAVVKDGTRGAHWAGRDGTVSVPAEPAGAVDPTGAGDAFAAGLLAAWLSGAGPAAALAAGARAGAAAVGVVGGRPVAGRPAPRRGRAPSDPSA